MDVNEVAKNARIRLNKKEKKKYEKEFEAILKHFSSIDEINTENVNPAFHPLDTKNELSEDIVENGLLKEQVFANTRNVEKKQFKGPKAVDK